MSSLVSLPVHRASPTIALVGNPNTGKTTLFNALTGFRQRVGNYPGVTVDKRTGLLRFEGDDPPAQVVDLPGAYSLGARGEDEAILLDVLLGRMADVRRPDLIVCVVDACHLSRNLFLTTQILELGKRVVVALTMADLAESSGRSVDAAALERELGVPVVPVVAPRGKGLAELRRAIQSTLHRGVTGHCPSFPECVCAELDGLCKTIHSPDGDHDPGAARVEAMQTLLDPGGYHESRVAKRCGLGLAEELAERRRRIVAAGESVVEVEARVRYEWIDRVVSRVVPSAAETRRSRTEVVDRVLLHRVAGLVIFAGLMALCFQAIYTWAGPLMDAVEGVFAALGDAVSSVMPEGALRSLVVDGVIAGVGSVLVFLPQILILFFFLAVLEDCGYMARAAFLMDRWMGFFGLGGLSFVPLLSSFACAIPGVMATRTIEDRRDRFVTMLIAPLMSCSARLPVYTLLIAAFVPSTPLLGGFLNLQAAVLLAMYMVGTVVAVPVAWILKRTLLKGPPQSFLMELPGYKRPSVRTVFFRVYEQGRAFVTTAGTIIFAVSIVIWALGYYPRPASIIAEHDALRAKAQEDYQVGLRGQGGVENRDAISGTGGAVRDPSRAIAKGRERISSCPGMAAVERRDERLAEIDQMEAGALLRASFLGRLGHVIEPVVEPLGWDWRIGTAVIAAFAAREVVVGTMGTIYNLGSGADEESVGLRETMRSVTWPDGRPVFNTAVALSIMVFFALCCQCASTLAVIKRETKTWRWPVFAFTYMTGLAYLAALATYQIAIQLA